MGSTTYNGDGEIERPSGRDFRVGIEWHFVKRTPNLLY